MYTAKREKLINIRPGCWEHSLVGVYKGEKKVAEYIRTYPNFEEKTFAAFERDGNWYALYSEDYTSISIARLPSMEKIGGETPDSFGFCPAEILIPRYTKQVILGMSQEKMEKLNIPKENRERASKDIHYKEYNFKAEDLKDSHFENFAMVAGCVWGDDSCWKFQLRDISRAHEGIISNIPFEYTELYPSCSLKDIVIDEDYGQISFQVPAIKYLRMANGKVSTISE